jgi:AAA15 family ATPase/GTPase
MLIEFSVTNFLSFAEKQTLSMVADSSKELQDSNTFLPESKTTLARLLHSASIYGANAAGKSNLLLAMKAMRKIVLSSAKENQGDEIKAITPHALHTDKPTEFELIFIVDKVRYQYGFAATPQMITEEWLFAFPTGRAQQWLSRVYDMDSKESKWYINQSFVKGNKSVWKDATRNNALFLSTAAQLNSEQFGKVSEWFKHNLNVGMTEHISPSRSLELCQNPESKQKVLQFLSTADLGISDIEVIKRPLSLDSLPDELPLEIKQRLLQKIKEDDLAGKSTVTEVSFYHQNSDGKRFQLSPKWESTGTRRLFESAGMWLDVLEQGLVICVDELESSLHPLIARFLVSLFNNPETNPKNAQLIFTTHDTTLLDNDLLRRDQVWFVEKDQDQVTHLYPLSDFKPRKHEALQKGYLLGRYSALPYVSSPSWLE